MQVNVGEAKTRLSQLLALAEAGEEVEIARAGVPVVRLVPVQAGPTSPGSTFLAMRGVLRGKIWLSDDVEFSEAELDEMLERKDDPLNGLGVPG